MTTSSILGVNPEKLGTNRNILMKISKTIPTLPLKVDTHFPTAAEIKAKGPT
jgi:hypothetical protein